MTPQRHCSVAVATVVALACVAGCAAGDGGPSSASPPAPVAESVPAAARPAVPAPVATASERAELDVWASRTIPAVEALALEMQRISEQPSAPGAPSPEAEVTRLLVSIETLQAQPAPVGAVDAPYQRYLQTLHDGLNLQLQGLRGLTAAQDESARGIAAGDAALIEQSITTMDVAIAQLTDGVALSQQADAHLELWTSALLARR